MVASRPTDPRFTWKNFMNILALRGGDMKQRFGSMLFTFMDSSGKEIIEGIVPTCSAHIKF